VEVVNFRLKIVGRTKKIRFPQFPFEGTNPQKAFIKEQIIVYQSQKHTASVFDRAGLVSGNVIHGPALVVEHESTTFLPPASSLKVDEFANLIIERRT